MQNPRLGDVVVVVDVSKSMCQNLIGNVRKIDVAKKAVEYIAKVLSEKKFIGSIHIFQVPSRTGSFRRVGVVGPDSELVAASLRRLEECLPGTPLYSVLSSVVEYVAKYVGNGIILYVGDGRSTEPYTKIHSSRESIMRIVEESRIRLSALIIDRSLGNPLISLFFEKTSGVPPAIITPYTAVREEFLYDRIRDLISSLIG